jgi:hypothetical protein
MNARDPCSLAQHEFRLACEAVAVLEQAVPAFRELVVAFREPPQRFLAMGAATTPAGLAELAQSLSRHAKQLSDVKQAISSNVAIAMDSIERYRRRLEAVDRGRGAYEELQGLIGSIAEGIADAERMIAAAEMLLEGEVHRIQELALRFDLPDSVLQLSQRLIARAQH